MADFKDIIRIADEGINRRGDYPVFVRDPWENRKRWSKYLDKINEELDANAVALASHAAQQAADSAG